MSRFLIFIPRPVPGSGHVGSGGEAPKREGDDRRRWGGAGRIRHGSKGRKREPGALYARAHAGSAKASNPRSATPSGSGKAHESLYPTRGGTLERGAGDMRELDSGQTKSGCGKPGLELSFCPGGETRRDEKAERVSVPARTFSAGEWPGPSLSKPPLTSRPSPRPGKSRRRPFVGKPHLTLCRGQFFPAVRFLAWLTAFTLLAICPIRAGGIMAYPGGSAAGAGKVPGEPRQAATRNAEVGGVSEKTPRQPKRQWAGLSGRLAHPRPG